MSINNISLPGMLIADLYKNHLLLVPDDAKQAVPEPLAPQQTEVTVPAEPEVPVIQFLGKHLKKVTVLVSFPQETYLPDNQLNFLANVLKACNLTLADIAIVNVARQQVSWSMLKSSLAPASMILFDVEAAAIELKIDLTPFVVTNDEDVLLLKAPALQKLNQNNEEGKLLKSKLWICLKKLFSV